MSANVQRILPGCEPVRVHDSSTTEVWQSLDRCLSRYKAEAIGEACGVSRAQVYDWWKNAHHIPVAAVAPLARLDSDPSALDRLCGALHRADEMIEMDRASRGLRCVVLP